MKQSRQFNVEFTCFKRWTLFELFNFDYTGGTPILYDLTNGKRYVGDVSVADTIKFLTEASTVATNLVLVNSAASNALEIANLETRNFVNYSNVANQGNYLIISNPLIYGTGNENYVEQYKQYRSSVVGGVINNYCRH
jgi:hypothetical protein